MMVLTDGLEWKKLLTFLAASIPLLTIQVDYVIQYIKPSIPRDPANAYAAGYIILIIVQVKKHGIQQRGEEKKNMLC